MGIGLTLGLWGLDSVAHSLSGVGDLLTVGTLAAGGGYWWYSQRDRQPQGASAPVEIDRATLDRVLSQVELVIDRLAIECHRSGHEGLRQQLTQAQRNLTRTDRQIAITGGQKVGKSSLMKLLTTEPVPSTDSTQIHRDTSFVYQWCSA